MTAQLSREIVENLLHHNDESDSPANAEAWEVNALCRLALAGLDSEPVVYIGKQMLESLCDEGGRTCGRVWRSDKDELSRESRIPLYAAPPAPVAVPDELTFEKIAEITASQGYEYSINECICAASWWNACRAAMLKAGPVTVKCPKCGDTGLADSGGVQPWGEPITVPCDCIITAAPEQEV